MQKTCNSTMLAFSILLLLLARDGNASDKNVPQVTKAASSACAVTFDDYGKDAERSYGKDFTEHMKVDPNRFDDLPEDVKCFAASAGICERMGESVEYATNEESLKEIYQDVLKYCGNTEKMSPVLKKKYDQDVEINMILSGCDRLALNVCSGFNSQEFLKKFEMNFF